jgi:hypothetical protein
MIKNLLNLFFKKPRKHCPRVAWLRYCMENPSAAGCRIYDV